MPPRATIPLPSSSSAKSKQCLSNAPLRFYATSQFKSKTKAPTTATAATFTPGQIPPESPKYISIPQSRQIEAIHRPWLKGVLPIPRKIFSRNAKRDKFSPEYIHATAPPPQSLVKPLPKDPSVADYIQYKAKQATARRRNLREGLTELYNRKQMMDHVVATRSAAKQALNRKLLYAPTRDDERFTVTSVSRVMQPSAQKGIPDPDREERVAQMRQRTEAKEVARREERRNMLHTLYMNARSFIVTPEALDKAIDEAFNDTEKFKSNFARGENIWNLGFPENVQLLLHHQKNDVSQGSGSAQQSTYGPVTKRRLDRIAEELTGGKMDAT